VSQLHSFLNSVDLHQIAQVELEQKSHDYRSLLVEAQIEKAKASGNASSSATGKALLPEYIQTLGKHYLKVLPKYLKNNKVIPTLEGAYPFLAQLLEAESDGFANQLANLVLTQLFNATFSTVDNQAYNLVIPPKTRSAKAKFESVYLSSSCEYLPLLTVVGKEIETVAKLQEIAKLADADPDTYWAAVRKHKQALQVNEQFAKSKYVEFVEAAGFTWQAWSDILVCKVAEIFVGQVFKAFPSGALFQHRTHYEDGKPNKAVIAASSVLQENAVLVEEAATFAARLNLPLVEPPQPWSKFNDFYGGYHLNAVLASNKLVRRKDNLKPKVGPQPLAALHNLQSVQYVVNNFVLDTALAVIQPLVEQTQVRNQQIADEAKANGTYPKFAKVKIGKFVPPYAGQSTVNAKKAYRTQSVLTVASKYRDVVFYHAWNFDYRGRLYPLASVLHPQSSDFEKSLLKFNTYSELTEDAVFWLKVQVANTAGLDKKSYADRVAWVDANHELISAVATAPVENLQLWKDQSEPWEFLAACEEFYACVIAGTRSHSNLPVAVDATCSGIQILAGITRDAAAAKLVNVTPSDVPQDAYAAVAGRAIELLQSPNDLPKVPSSKTGKPRARVSFDTHSLLTRSVAKKVVMTVPYNARSKSNKEAVKASLVDAFQVAVANGEEFKFPTSAEIDELVHALRVAIEEVLPGPLAFRNWLNEAAKAKAVTLKGKTPLVWTSPSGFEALQFKNVPKTVPLQVTVGGKSLDLHVTTGWTSEVDANRHAVCTAPNLIHSLDASVLHFAFTKWDRAQGFTVIHDSVLALPGSINTAQKQLRNAYANIFSNDFAGELAVLLDAPTLCPVFNTFDPEEVKKSQYFFC
jgi:DNA-directed RNA polymerase